jgi:hypothetical protein
MAVRSRESSESLELELRNRPDAYVRRRVYFGSVSDPLGSTNSLFKANALAFAGPLTP